MRRQPEVKAPNLGRFEVIIRAPTLGLVTRVPGDQPDPRAATQASNVRFDDGVIRNAPGCAPVLLGSPLDSAVNLIFQVNVAPASGMVANLATILIATQRKLYALTSLEESQFGLTADQLIEFHGEVRSLLSLRLLPTAPRVLPLLIAVSIADDLELWRLRRRTPADADDGAGLILPADYGFQTNNVIWERVA